MGQAGQSSLAGFLEGTVHLTGGKLWHFCVCVPCPGPLWTPGFPGDGILHACLVCDSLRAGVYGMPCPAVAQDPGAGHLGLPHDAGLHAGVGLVDEGCPDLGAGNRVGDPGNPEGLDVPSQLCTGSSCPRWTSGLFWRQGLFRVYWPGAYLRLWTVVLQQREGPGLILSTQLPALRSWRTWGECPCECLA